MLLHSKLILQMFIRITSGSHLTVSDLWVAVCIGREDASERSDAGGVLESRVVRQGTVKVSLNLICGQVAVSHRLLHQAGVVALMGLQLRGGICTGQQINRLYT